MFKKKTIPELFFFSSISIIFTLIVFFGGLWIMMEYKRFSNESDQMEKDYIFQQKLTIRNEVMKVIEHIEQAKTQKKEEIKSHIRTKVYDAWIIVSHLYETFKDIKPPDEVKKIIREALRKASFNAHKGYYFILSFDGKIQLLTTHPDQEGQIALDWMNVEGQSIIKDMIRIVGRDGEGFYRYDWSKPGSQGVEYPKIVYLKCFKPYDWIIGAGIYLDDVEAALQEEILEKVRKIRFGKDGYVFVFRFDGVYLSHFHEKYVGKNMMWVRDPNGVPINEKLYEISRRKNGGYLEYVWNKPSLKHEIRKITYAKSVEEWGWVVGAGVYIDDIEAAIQKKLHEYNNMVFRQIGIIILLLLLFFIFSVLIAKFFSKNIKKGTFLFTDFFQKAAKSYEHIDENQMMFYEFKILARYANVMVDHRKQADDTIRKAKEDLEDRVHERTRELWEANESLRKEIKERKLAEEALSSSREKLLKEHTQRVMLSKRLLELLEKDRHNTAMEVHDHIGQNLTSLKINLELLQKELSSNDIKTHFQIQKAIEQVSQIIKDARNVSHSLRPSLLDTLGLLPTLRQFFEDIEHQSNIKIHFYHQNITKSLEKDKELSIYRIVQESFNNIIKHAGAQTVYVNLMGKDHCISLSIEDDGLGFDPENIVRVGKNSMGLMFMRERVIQLNGDFQIESKKGKGTLILIDIPLKNIPVPSE